MHYFHTAAERWAPGSLWSSAQGRGGTTLMLFSRGQVHPLSTTLLDDDTEMWGAVSYKA
ncbi:MAG TPA: hypothetical protein VF711_00220 [Acidimicrobiales bacterium]